MPRPALTDEQRDIARRTIRRAAADLYKNKDQKEVTVRAVAERAGVSVGTIYSYFGSLTGLMQSLWKEPVKRLIAELEEIASQHSDPRNQLRALFEAYLDFAHDQRPTYRGAFMFVRKEALKKSEQVGLADDRLFGLFKAAVIAGQEAQQFKSGDATQLTQLLWAGVHGAIALPINLDRLALDTPEQLAPAMLDVLLDWIEIDTPLPTE